MNKLQAILLGIRLTGLPNSLRALSYTRKRDKLEAKYPLPAVPGATKTGGKLISASATSGGATFHFENTALTVRFLSPDFLFLAWDGAAMSPSYAVSKTDWATINCALTQTQKGWDLTTNSIKLSILNGGELIYCDAGNRPLRQESPPLKQGIGWQHTAALTPEACIYGLGEKAAGLNLRPGSYRCWNSDPGGSYGTGRDPLYIGMPVYLCLQDAGAYLAFYDNPYACAVTLDSSASIKFDGGPLRYYLAFGSPSSVLQRYIELTGKPPLPPRWALGYQQSYWGYGSESEMRRVFKGFQDNKLPLSVLHMDIDFMDGYRVFTPDLKRYPDLPGFAAELEKSGVHLVAITDPGIKIDPKFDLYTDGLKAGAFCKDPGGNSVEGVVWPGWVVYPDFTDPAAREWWGKQYTRIFKYGISGIWHDMNEPVSYTAWGDFTLPLCTRHELDGEKGDHRQAHNLYGMLMNRAGYEGIRRLKPDNRPFIVTRSGWAGMQRYSWCWTGDVETSWQALRQTIPTVLGLGLCGMPYSGPDTGGFSGHPTPELYVRWFQLTSFLPFFRTHCAFFLPRREPWEFGEEVVDIVRSQLELRYSLMPYWYTLAYQTSLTGEPVIRPLLWDEPGNRELWNIQDSFLVGGLLLIAPILEEGSAKRDIRLPQGGWYELNGDTLIKGGRNIEMEAPLDKLPVLVRAGSILPTVENDRLVLHVYRPEADSEGSGMIYSDSGDGYGPYRVDMFNLKYEKGDCEISWTSGGDYPWPYGIPEMSLHGFAGQEVRLQRR
jgi:alpha-glucosidase